MEIEIDVERQREARTYARLRRRFSFIGLGCGAVSVLLVIGLGWDRWLRDLLRGAFSQGSFLNWQPHTGWYPLQLVLYFLIVFLVYELLTSPLSYYAGFVLPHRFGLSTLTLGGWLKDLFKGLALNIILEALAISLIYTLLAYQPQTWWLWVALVMLFFSVVMANLAPVLLYPLFYKFTPLPEGELTQRLLALVTRAKTRVRGVYTMHLSSKTTAANAALMGLGNTRRIVLGDTMLDRYSTDEIEVVLAHELGHHVHQDIWKLIVSQSVITLAGLFVANLILHEVVDSLHFYQSLTDPATLPFFFLLVGVFSLLVMPLGNAYSRRIEYQADEYALQSTKNISAFKSAMIRLANQNLSDIEPSPLIEALFYSHPSIKKRLLHADEFAARHASAWDASSSISAAN
ncbi:MAG TPA: M48 family metallopeptidase [Ktedonobacteraceae bacterium]|nr:M48 family metallopeptidase [Ktedonobacteraceae bacterium]